MAKTIDDADFRLLGELSNKPDVSTKELGSTIGLRVPEVRRRVARLKTLGLIAPSPGRRGAMKLTGRGRFALERHDPKVAVGYLPRESVPDYVAFKFALGEGIMTGDVAHSYGEFLDVVKKADSRSLAFHLYRGDFDNWFAEVFRDRKVSKRLVALKARTHPVDQLRTKLVKILESRVQEMGSHEV